MFKPGDIVVWNPQWRSITEWPRGNKPPGPFVVLAYSGYLSVAKLGETRPLRSLHGVGQWNPICFVVDPFRTAVYKRKAGKLHA